MSHSAQKTEDLFDFAKILGQQTEFHEILRLVAHKSAQSLKADLALILMLNPDTRETVKTIIKDGKYIEQKEYQDIHTYVGGWIINHQKHFLSRNLQKDEQKEIILHKHIKVPLLKDYLIRSQYVRFPVFP